MTKGPQIINIPLIIFAIFQQLQTIRLLLFLIRIQYFKCNELHMAIDGAACFDSNLFFALHIFCISTQSNSVISACFFTNCAQYRIHTLIHFAANKYYVLFRLRHRVVVCVCNSKIIVVSHPFCFISVIKLEYRLKLNIITFFILFIIYLSLKLSSSVFFAKLWRQYSIRWESNIEQLLTAFCCSLNWILLYFCCYCSFS